MLSGAGELTSQIERIHFVATRCPDERVIKILSRSIMRFISARRHLSATPAEHATPPPDVG